MSEEVKKPLYIIVTHHLDMGHIDVRIEEVPVFKDGTRILVSSNIRPGLTIRIEGFINPVVQLIN